MVQLAAYGPEGTIVAPRPPKRNSPPKKTTTAKKGPAVKSPFVGAESAPKENLGRFILIYGPPGEGKTSLAGQFEKPLFFTTYGEQGIHYLKKAGVVPADIPVIDLPAPWDESNIPSKKNHPGYDLLLSNLDIFVNGDHDRKTCVIDTLSGADTLALQTCASQQFGGDMASRSQEAWNHYANGPRKTAKAFWSRITEYGIAAAKAGKTVILLAHTATRPVVNLDGSDYDHHRPSTENSIWMETHKDLTDIVYLGRHLTFTTDPATKKKKVNSNSRFFGVENSTYYVAKNWINARGEVSCGKDAAETYAKLADKLKL
jgi:peptidoglycan hydrolase-like protein with peptidoglycan-binding domain